MFDCKDRCHEALNRMGVNLNEVDEAGSDPDWCITSVVRAPFGTVRTFLGRTESKRILLVVAKESLLSMELMVARDATPQEIKIYTNGPCHNK